LAFDCLQDSCSWIIYPTRVNFYACDDGKIYSNIGRRNTKIEANVDSISITNFKIKLEKKINTRFIKIIATNYGILPQ
jgi:hypothetical protein